MINNNRRQDEQWLRFQEKLERRLESYREELKAFGGHIRRVITENVASQEARERIMQSFEKGLKAIESSPILKALKELAQPRRKGRRESVQSAEVELMKRLAKIEELLSNIRDRLDFIERSVKKRE